MPQVSKRDEMSKVADPLSNNPSNTTSPQAGSVLTSLEHILTKKRDMSSKSCEDDSEEHLDIDIEGFCLEDDDVSLPKLFPELYHDIEHLKQHYPSDKVTHRSMGEFHEVNIQMTMDLDLIKQNLLDAWGLTKALPLLLVLFFSPEIYFADSYDSNVAVFQDQSKKQNGILLQIKNIAKRFIRQSTRFAEVHENCTLQKKADDSTTYKLTVYESKENMQTASGCKEGFLVQLHSYIQERLHNLNDYCPICDKFHGSETSMIKPIVCTNPLCLFQSQVLGVDHVCPVIDTQPEVVNLLISFTLTAVNSSRLCLVLCPFPTVVDSSYEFVFPQNETGISSLRKVLATLSSFKLNGISMEAKCHDKVHGDFCYPLLRWIIASNRSYILYIPPEKQLKIMSTSHQFVMRSSPPAEDASFRALAEKYGTFFAFHGSPVENWHSIIRQGLIVASGTDYQLHGFASGKGIYVTKLLHKALYFAGHLGIHGPTISNKAKDVKSDRYLCIALCEVIKGPHLRKVGDDWVVKESDHLCTRFIFRYEPTTAIGLKKCDIKSTSDVFIDSVRNILSDI